ncbi:MAG: aldehyde ferredoxin oxidoreductase family protein [Candidatus Nezhaarchaeota archaeon]|nr:aldehyde ferredoxin oxidoreductase family protein [Candidatus Nezhaarchaeota archaeon]
MAGWWKKLLRIDLSRKTITVEEVKDVVLKEYLGGSGFGAMWLYENTRPGVEPLSPDNAVVLAVGPLTGSRVYGTSRASMITRSPLTMTLFDSTCGGVFPTYFKRCGLDALIIQGASSKPVYIYLNEGCGEVLPAGDLWGLKTKEAVLELRKRHGFNCSAVAIGPAGENLVRMASIADDNGHAFGRGGVGAVLGSKKVKAIVASGTKTVEEAKPEKVDEMLENMKVRITWNPYLWGALRNLGTSALLTVINDWGLLPVMNFSEGFSESAEKLAGEELTKFVVGRRGCYNCPIACKRVTKIGETKGDGPEYESIVNLGSMLGISDLGDVIELNHLCNDLGLDTISMGGTLACLIELATLNKVNIDLMWGDSEKVKALIIETAYRRGIGNDVAEGSLRLARKYGMIEASVSVKGLEVPAYDPRGAFGMALSYATSYRGACHLRSWTISFEVIGTPNLVDRFSVLEKPALVKYTQDLAAVYDSLLVCKHFAVEFNEEPLSSLLSAVTGLDFSKEELLAAGERIWTIARLFNIREGFTGRDDVLPPKLQAPLTKGPIAGRVPPIQDMIKEYYSVRDWDSQGIPSRKLLDRLNLRCRL